MNHNSNIDFAKDIQEDLDQLANLDDFGPVVRTAGLDDDYDAYALTHSVDKSDIDLIINDLGIILD